MKTVDEVIVSLLKEKGVNEILVENVKGRLETILDSIATTKEKKTFILNEKDFTGICGFLDGVLLILASIDELTYEDHKDILDRWLDDFIVKDQ